MTLRLLKQAAVAETSIGKSGQSAFAAGRPEGA
jgi:hypothetical protein